MGKEHNHNHVDDGLGCNCGHCHSMANNIKDYDNGKSKFYCFVKDYGFTILRIVISTILLVFGMILPLSKIVSTVIFSVAFVVVGYEILFDCIKLIVKGKIFNENLLMLIASIVAFILGEFYEGIIILLLYTLGELLESVATNNSRKRIAGLSELKCTVVRLIDKKGINEVEPNDVHIGSFIEVRKGDKVPIDGELFGINGVFDFKTITGESKLVNLEVGQIIPSGAINVGETVIVKTTKLYQDSTVSKIISLVEGANAKKAKSQKFIANFSKYYTPIIVILGVIIATIIPLFDNMNFIKWTYKALNFIVISCPCALVISVPLCFFIGIGSLSRKGVLIKGSSYIDSLSQTKMVIFDKTGTLTKGQLIVEKVEIFDQNYSLDYIGSVSLTLEKSSSHPIANAVCSYFKNSKLLDIENYSEKLGYGVCANINENKVLIGNQKFLAENGIKTDNFNNEIVQTVLCVAIGEKHVANIYICDSIKENAKNTITELKSQNIRKTFMISGDNQKVCQQVGENLGIDNVFSQLLPNEKFEKLEEIIKENKNGKVMYVGDGVNDAPSITLADVGVSMGAIGSDCALECADVVIMDDDIGKIPLSIKYSKRIKRKVLQNIIGSLSVKLSIMILSILIPLPIWVAMLADVGVMLLAILNSLSNYAIKYKK